VSVSGGRQGCRRTPTRTGRHYEQPSRNRWSAGLDARGAVADICSTVLDEKGAVIGGTDVAARCIAITTEQLRAIPDVLVEHHGDPTAAQAETVTKPPVRRCPAFG